VSLKFAVLCQNGATHALDRLLSTARSRVTRYDQRKPGVSPMACGPHRIQEERPKKPKRKPLTLWAVVCKDGRFHSSSIATHGRRRVFTLPYFDELGCGPHKVVKLVEEVRK
jgi:hypothetical protein